MERAEPFDYSNHTGIPSMFTPGEVQRASSPSHLTNRTSQALLRRQWWPQNHDESQDSNNNRDFSVCTFAHSDGCRGGASAEKSGGGRSSVSRHSCEREVRLRHQL